MVLQRRLDYGFNGCHVPVVPRCPRSAKGKRSSRKRASESQMCAFDLLATVAGKLLEEDVSPAPVNSLPGESKRMLSDANVKLEIQDEGKPSNVGPCDQWSCHEGARLSDIGFQRQAHAYGSKECSQTSSSAGRESCLIVVKTDPSELVSAVETVCDKNVGENGTLPRTYQGRVDNGNPPPFPFEDQTTEIDGFHRHGVPCCSEEPMKVDAKLSLSRSESSVEIPLHGDHLVHPDPECRNDMTRFPVNRDDDEKSSGCTQPCYISSKSAMPQRIVDWRTKKMLASKFRKVVPTLLKDEKISNTGREAKPVFRGRKMCYTRQRTQRCPFKRRRLFERGVITTSKRRINSEGNGAASSVTGQKVSFESDGYHVKLNIKSFRVPELFIELPETTTVGALKRTVVDAVTAIFCGGFRVGVLLQGKKLCNDNKTLLQAGISHADKLESLVFTLKPKSSQASSKLTANSDNTCFLSACDQPRQPKGVPEVSTSDAVMFDACTEPAPPLAAFKNCVDSDHDSAPSPIDTTTSAENMNTPDAKALVVFPPMDPDALAVVPFHRSSRRAETAPRRIRRPFSVSEVEALVQAVENLGTGRWRDVKLRAFENASHRTYVDLKDKWKTLVHTANISPQQRRGEPVPQELLDRVLSANAYWSQHQAKLQVKQQQRTEQLLLA